ncbi:MAG: hypothetical protein M1274_13920 [Actinobacteria bacterium]|nr:hypothetical protein [Actinomycetota bacterium]
MRKMWKHKWIVVGVALVVFLSVGTAAWAAAGSGGPSAATGLAGVATLATTATTQGPPPALGAPNSRRAALKERCQQFAQRQQQLLDLLREKMSPADQAKYDQLTQQIKDQQAALQKARTDLSTSLKDLRDLTNKYLNVPATGGTTSTTGATTQ